MQADGGEAAGRGGHGAGAHRLLVLLPGLAQVDVDVDQPGRDHQPGGVERLGVLRRLDAAVEPGDAAVLDQQVERLVEVLAGIDHPAAMDQKFRHAQARLLVDAGEQIEDRHAHRDAVGDLLQDHRGAAVRHLARDLDAAVHRSGVHDDDVVLGRRQPRGGQAEELEVLADRREGHPPLPLELDAQHHDHVGVADRLLQRSRPPRRPSSPSRPASACAVRRWRPWRPSCAAGGCSSAPPGCARCRRRWRP